MRLVWSSLDLPSTIQDSFLVGSHLSPWSSVFSKTYFFSCSERHHCNLVSFHSSSDIAFNPWKVVGSRWNHKSEMSMYVPVKNGTLLEYQHNGIFINSNIHLVDKWDENKIKHLCIFRSGCTNIFECSFPFVRCHFFLNRYVRIFVCLYILGCRQKQCSLYSWVHLYT